MIVDQLTSAARYYLLHPGLEAGLRWAVATDLESLEPGRIEVEGDQLFVLMADSEGRGQADSPLEAHRKYIDIQLVLRGSDTIGWRSTRECRRPRGEFNHERDILFYDDEAAFWLPVGVGQFAIFFPEDAHAPLAGSGAVRKAVIKVAEDWA